MAEAVSTLTFFLKEVNCENKHEVVVDRDSGICGLYKGLDYAMNVKP